MKRTVIKINENLCNGCGFCVEGCHERALQLIDGKARIINETFCDGLGACIGECPLGAIEFEEKEAQPYDKYANLTFFPEEDTSGFLSIGMGLDLVKDDFTDFYVNTPKEIISVENNFVIPFSKALKAAASCNTALWCGQP